MSREVALTIEKFYNDEEEKFLIYSRKEIQLILHAVAQKKNRTILYFDHGKQFIQTMLLAVDHEGMWLDVGPDGVINKHILNSHDLVLVSMHQQAKIQLDGNHIYLVSYAGNPAFYMTLPDKLLRLQRRDYFRLPIPPDAALKCVIPPGSDDAAKHAEVTIMDISVGGVALVCKENTIRLEEGKTYPDCRIDLPGIGTLKVTIHVRNMFDTTNKHGVVTKHAGCEFMNLNGQMSMLLQRYIAQMQRKLIAATR